MILSTLAIKYVLVAAKDKMVFMVLDRKKENAKSDLKVHLDLGKKFKLRKVIFTTSSRA